MHSDKGRDLVDAFAGAVLDDLQHTDGRERLRRRSVDYAGEGAAHGGHAPGGVGVDGLGLALRAVDAWPGARCDASPPCTLHHCAGASVSARCFLVQLYPLIRTDA